MTMGPYAIFLRGDPLTAKGFTMSKIKILTALTTLEGVEMNDENEKKITLRLIACNALQATFDDERNLSGEEKIKRFNLALKITKTDFPDLSAEEIAEIKKLIAKGYPPLIVGRCYEILDPKTNDEI
jgi:hypothetical protein